MSEIHQILIKIIVLCACIISVGCEAPKYEVLVDYSYIKEKSNFTFDSTQSFTLTQLNHNMTFVILDSLYPNLIIDTVFFRGGHPVGFIFQIDSGFLGLAKLNYSNNRDSINSISFFNIFDLRIKQIFEPSSEIAFFVMENNFQMLFDSYSNSLYKWQNNRLVPFTKGLKDR